MIQIEIPGKPVAKARPRFARRGKFVKTYNCQETEEGRFMWELSRSLERDGLKIPETPFSVRIVFVIPRPKGHYGTGRNAGKLKPSAPEFHTQKPDADNLGKFVLDCCNGVVWQDDAEVVHLEKYKRWTRPGEEPKTIIMIDSMVEYMKLAA